MTGQPIRVLVVDDSALMRDVIPAILNRASDIQVVATASDPMQARALIKQLNPDVLTLDVEMPKMDGVSFLEKIMTLRPMPVVMLSSLTQAGAETTLRALELGAVDFITKPSLDLAAGLDAMAEDMIAKVRAAARAKVRRATVRGEHKQVAPLGLKTSETVIALGASTGGVEVLGRLIAALPADAPGIVITQHMPPKFTANFAARLDQNVALAVSEAETGRRLRPGQVVIAPGDRHLVLKRSGADFICHLDDGPAVSGHKPSVDVMFRSVARACGANAIGVILTGMGRDGADGLLEMRQAGAHTLGQNEDSALVYGMPRAAQEAGAVMEEMTDQALPARLLALAAKRSPAVRI